MKKYHSLIVVVAFILSSCSVIHVTPSKKIKSIAFTEKGENESYKFIYQDTENSPELTYLKSLYRLDSIADMGKTEFEQILHLMKWTSNRWEHSGSNQPSKSNTLTILKEAETGKKFRCVEYGIVLRSVLAANGFKARTLALKTRDVETTRFGAGHVLTEVWSVSHNKWLMVDAQFNVVPTLNNKPLNAVEFQNAIVQKEAFKLEDIGGEVSENRTKKYLNFIPHYLYYFDIQFDQREVAYKNLLKVNNKTSLMLVPNGAKIPVVFQRKFKMDYFEYTSSLKDFYRMPQ